MRHSSFRHLARFTSLAIVGYSLATAWSKNPTSSDTTEAVIAVDPTGDDVDLRARQTSDALHDLLGEQDKLSDLLQAIEYQVAVLDPAKDAAPAAATADAKADAKAAPADAKAGPAADAPAGPAAASPGTPPNGGPAREKLDAVRKTLETWLQLSYAKDPMIVKKAIEQLGALANAAEDVNLQLLAFDRLLEISRCGKVETRETYAAVDAIYSARRNTGPLLAARLTPVSPLYIANGQLQIFGCLPCTPGNEIIFQDDIVSAGLLQVLADGLVAESKLLVTDPDQLMKLIRLFAAAKQAEPHSRFVRDAAIAGMNTFLSITKLDDALALGITGRLARTYPGPHGKPQRLEPPLATELLTMVTKAAVDPTHRSQLAQDYAAIAVLYFDDQAVLKELVPAVANLHTQMEIAADPRIVPPPKPVAHASSTFDPKNPFFVSTEVDSAGKLPNVSTKAISARFGARPRLDPGMIRASGTPPQNRQAGLRKLGTADVGGPFRTSEFEPLGAPTGSGGARATPTGAVVGTPTAPPIIGPPPATGSGTGSPSATGS